MGTVFSQAATAVTGTKAASMPRKRYGRLRRLCCCVMTSEASVDVIERFGRFNRIVGPGLHPVAACLGEAVAGRLSTAQQHQEVQCEVKTADGVFVELVYSVQYRVAPDRQYEAFYSLTHPAEQVTSYVLDAVGCAVAGMSVEELFRRRKEMVAAVRRGVEGVLHEHGFAVQDCLLTVMAPTASVKEAMSNVKAAQRQRVAAWEQGEADKIRSVKHAEAGAETKYLAGQGVARFIVALASGVREGVKVLLTGRLQPGDLAFPEPPPVDDAATLAAAAAHVEELEGGSKQEGAKRGDKEEEGHKESSREPHTQLHDIHASAATSGSPLAAGMPGKVAAGPSMAALVAQPALLPPQATGTPSRGMQAGARKAVAQAR